MVLVHGSLDRATSFSRVLRRLEGVDAVAYDRRGYARSRQVPVSALLDRHVDDLLDLIDGRSAVVFGHSMGGLVALGAALRPEAPLLGVIAFEPPMPWLPLWTRRPRGADASATAVDPAAEAERFFRRMVGDEAWERLPEAARAERLADGPALVADLTAVRVAQAPFAVADLAIPSVFARGAISAAHHRDTVEWCHHQVPGSQLVEVAGAQHGVHLTHPSAVAAMISDLLVQVTTP